MIGVILAVVLPLIFLNRKKKEPIIIYPFSPEIYMRPGDVIFFRKVNDTRFYNNITQINQWDKRMSQLARQHTSYMIEKSIYSHDNIEMRREELFKAGIKKYGEIVGRTDSDVADLVRRFIASPDHYKEMINPEYNCVGLSIQANDFGTLYGTMIFAKI